MPEPLNLTERLQDFIRQFINRLITEDFRDLEEIPLDGLDINVPRHAVKLICIHDDKDSLIHTVIRLLIYGFFVYLPSLLGEGYFMPYIWLHENFDFIPQIKLYFVDDPRNRPIVYRKKPLEAEVAIRLHFINISEISARREIDRLADRILLNFRNFKFTKGTKKYSYNDKSNKFTTWSFFASRSEAVSLFRNLCLILDIPFNDENITEALPTKNYSVPERRRIMGQQYEIERRRSGVVEFKQADLHIQGIKPIRLVNKLKTFNVTEYIKSFYE